MSITTVGSHLIHYEAVGRGEPLIFIHGWLGSWRYWWPAMQAMSKHYRAFAFDLWGFGDSSKVSERYKFAAYVDMLGAFMENLGIVQPVTLVGHALGAAVALRFASLWPEKIKRLAAVSLPVQGNDISSRLAASDGSDGSLSRLLGRSNLPEVESELRKTDSEAVTGLARELAQYNFADDLENVRCPVLIIFGDQDHIIEKPGGEYERFQKTVDNRAFVTLEACSHFPMLEETAKFSRLLLEFAHANNNLAQLAPKDYWQRRTY